jgi:DNA-binding response OmpR family regulator
MRFGVTLREICALCGQMKRDPNEVVRLGDLELRPVDGVLLVRGTPVDLTPTERRMLTLLALSSPALVTWADLHEEAVGPLSDATLLLQKNNVRVHVARLRTKLGPCSRYLQSVRGPITEGGLKLVVP